MREIRELHLCGIILLPDATVGAPLVGARDGGAEKGDHEGRPYRTVRRIDAIRMADAARTDIKPA